MKLKIYPVHFDEDCLCVAMNRKGECEKCKIQCNKVVKVEDLREWLKKEDEKVGCMSCTSTAKLLALLEKRK